jgi:leader peptidase (prepilin peptidase)/N-methyltransferase
MVYVLVTVFGLVFGSFLNVCIFRLPHGESIVTPSSHCPKCGRDLSWYDNVPLASFLVLGGRCRQCGTPISVVYPAVEVLTAFLWCAAFYEFGLSAEVAKAITLGMLLIVLIFTDLLYRQIPRAVTRFGMAAALVFSFLVPVDNRPLAWILRRFGVYPAGIFDSLLGLAAGAVFGAGTFYAVGRLISWRLKKQALGFGDVMLMGMIGMFLGVPLTYITMFLGSLVGLVIALSLWAANPRYRRGYEWPYGTFLASGGIIASLAGNAMLLAYLQWSGVG